MAKEIKRLAAASAPKRIAASAKAAAHQKQLMAALMKFRLIVNLTKSHFKWVERQCGINGAQLWVLWELHRSSSLRVNELAAAMAMHQSTISNLVDRLARAKLVTRERAASDQRVVTVALTPRGEETLKRAPQPARGVLPEALDQLGESELKALDHLLGRVVQQMRPTDRTSMKEHLVDLLGDKQPRARARRP